MKLLAWGAVFATVAVLSVEAQPSAGACEALAGLKLPQVAITQAVTVAARSPLPAYCKILASAHPTSDSDIRFEVAIPEEGAWNGRYLQVGNGGYAGVIPEAGIRNHGGKLIQYHGWADPAIPALDSVDYYRLVQKKMGPTGNFYRLFMAPGMLHCRGGPGPNAIAALPALAAWVEHNKAPAFLVATKYQGDDPSAPTVRQRPLCSFPARAQWDGQGDRSKLESYRCVAPKA